MDAGNVWAARWGWVETGAATLRLPDSKTRAKDAPLSDAVLTILAGLPRSGPYVLPGRTGNPVSGHQKAWQAIRNGAGLPGLRLHDLRRTVGNHAAAAGPSMREIADLLGHKSLQSTQRYVNKLTWKQHDNANRIVSLLVNPEVVRSL